MENAITADRLYKQFQLDARRSPLFTRLKEVLWGADEVQSRPFCALNDVSFAVERGQRIALIGNNGAGKTTLLSLIAGLLQPTRGTLQVEGSVTYLGGHGIGMVEDLTVGENAFLYGAIYGLERRVISANLDEILAWANLEEFAATKFQNLSSGMRARLAFSITRYFDSDLFLFDEALAAGDKTFRQKCARVFEDFKDSDRTFVVASHNLEFVEGFCDRALWFHKGVLRAEGAADDVLAEYRQFGEEVKAAPKSEVPQP